MSIFFICMGSFILKFVDWIVHNQDILLLMRLILFLLLAVIRLLLSHSFEHYSNIIASGSVLKGTQFGENYWSYLDLGIGAGSLKILVLMVDGSALSREFGRGSHLLIVELNGVVFIDFGIHIWVRTYKIITIE